MGKSTVAAQFKRFGAVISDADAIVHHLIQPNTEVSDEIAKIFPETLEEGHINRQKLGTIVFNDSEKLKILENQNRLLKRKLIK